MTLGPGGAALRVRLIGKDNGVGLSRDFDFLHTALTASGCEVSRRGCERPDRKRRRSLWVRARARLRQRWPSAADWVCDVNIMLEHVWPQFLHQAPVNVIVPNPEWFDRRDLAFLGCADRIWAKTVLAQRLFMQRGCATSLIGFDSEDRYRPEVERRPEFFHLAGRSPLKGTARLLGIWQRHPEWPMLCVVQDRTGAAPSAANISYQRGYLDDDGLARLQNRHRFHLCTSEAEGWGHYIAEAMSVAAVVLTVDAAPMNELVGPDRGVLLSGSSIEPHNLATLCRFDEASLERAVARVMAMSLTEQRALGQAARTWFLTNKAGFGARVQRAVHETAAQVPVPAAGLAGTAL